MSQKRKSSRSHFRRQIAKGWVKILSSRSPYFGGRVESFAGKGIFFYDINSSHPMPIQPYPLNGKAVSDAVRKRIFLLDKATRNFLYGKFAKAPTYQDTDGLGELKLEGLTDNGRFVHPKLYSIVK